MNESKIDLTERLRREGRWAEASKYKDEVVKKLRASGLKRCEAGEQAWQEMAEAFPQTPPKPGNNYDMAMELLCSVAIEAVDGWKREYGITLPDDAEFELIANGLIHFWSAGSLGELPDHGKPWGIARHADLKGVGSGLLVQG
jgi:hypothetical protein